MQVTLLSDNPAMNAGMALSIVLFAFLAWLAALALLSALRGKRAVRPWKKLPAIDVLIPVHNGEATIEACLASVLAARYPAPRTILVVDDGSTDSTAAVVERVASRQRSVRLLRGKHRGKVGALRAGLAHTTRAHVVTIDADVEIEPGTLTALVTPLQDLAVGATNAVAFIHRPRRAIEHFQAVEYALNNLIRTSFERLFDNTVWFFGAVACYRREALARAGSFTTDTLTEDMDTSMALMSAGYKVVTAEDARITTDACPSARALVKQRMRWYVGALQSLWKHRGVLKRNRAPALVFLFANQGWWTLFSFLFWPLTAYQVWYWWPHAGALAGAGYLFRWFSLLGPAYVLYKLPDWGLNLLNIFGVSAGIVTAGLSVGALRRFSVPPRAMHAVVLFFYFPYTILMNLSIVAGVLSHPFKKTRYFKD